MSEVRFAAKASDPPSIEVGFTGFRAACYGAAPLPATQEKEIRQAFFAGAVWLFGYMQVLPDDEDEAMKRMNALDAEIRSFASGLRAIGNAAEPDAP